MQRGIARWTLALHSPVDRVDISPQKINTESLTKKSESDSKQVDDVDSGDETEKDSSILSETPSHDNSGPKRQVKDKDVDTPGGIPPPFTPSISRTLRKPAGPEVRPLPKTLSVTELRSRIGGKKKVKYVLVNLEFSAALRAIYFKRGAIDPTGDGKSYRALETIQEYWWVPSVTSHHAAADL